LQATTLAPPRQRFFAHPSPAAYLVGRVRNLVLALRFFIRAPSFAASQFKKRLRFDLRQSALIQRRFIIFCLLGAEDR
jgi:hypothetical protein